MPASTPVNDRIAQKAAEQAERAVQRRAERYLEMLQRHGSVRFQTLGKS